MPQKKPGKSGSRKGAARKGKRPDRKDFETLVGGAPPLRRGPRRIRLVGRPVASGDPERLALQLDDVRMLGFLLVFRRGDIETVEEIEGAGGQRLIAIEMPLSTPVQAVRTTTVDRIVVGLLRGARVLRWAQQRRNQVLGQSGLRGPSREATDFLEDPIELTAPGPRELAWPPEGTAGGTGLLEDDIELTLYQQREATSPSQDNPSPEDESEATDPLDDLLEPDPEDPDTPTSPLLDDIERTWGEPSEVTGGDQDELEPATDPLKDPIELTLSFKDWSFKYIDDQSEPPDVEPPEEDGEPESEFKNLIDPTRPWLDLDIPPKDPVQDLTMPSQDRPDEEPDQRPEEGYWEATQSNLFTDDLTFLWIGADVTIPF